MTAKPSMLFGRLLSPYVRRVAISLNVLGFPFERTVISAIGDETKREALNPVGRVPALRLASGEMLVDSAAILDHFDELAGPGRALIPPSGDRRRHALQRLAVATGAIDRAMTANAERRREAPDPARMVRLLRQCRQGFDALETDLDGREHFDGSRMEQAEITAAVGFTFVNHIFPGTLPENGLPGLSAMAGRAEALPEFRAARIDTPAD